MFGVRLRRKTQTQGLIIELMPRQLALDFEVVESRGEELIGHRHPGRGVERAGLFFERESLPKQISLSL